MKIKGTCRMCERDFLVSQVLATQGHCPSCRKPLSPDYTANLAEALRLAEAAGAELEDALEKVASLNPRMVLDEESVVGGLRESLRHTDGAARSRR